MRSSMAMLWAGLGIAPLVWAASLGANFALAPLACSDHNKGALYAISIIAFVLALGGAGLAWRQYSLLKATDLRVRMSAAFAGIALSFLFALVIFAQAIPNFILRGCE